MYEASGGSEPESPLALYRTIRACRICREAPIGRPLPIEPNPVLALSQTARIVVAGQAPGNLADKSTKPFNDPSGVRLRDWMGIGPEIFYDAARIAIVPMGFCFPGYDDKGGDLPPRRECRATWHSRVMAAMPQVELVLAIGLYAQRFHIEGAGRQSLTETVADWRSVLDSGGRFAPVLPLPHPSWRNNAWLKRHGWFAAELLPELQRRVAALI
ncbi:uracil-DNA glycosylase family protein [Jiella mangrovi]|uniref:Uracil-DNA glycosylase family protein n=1 Tax=Jiella mangrovi TaxID=2821407 RepID=A0ABS4BJT5_9HYPH|nr:uracil-DNA glycosylase family protein [Jiella mangrovi]MBP0616190.1 uracil-DNA glycosylase family protein [Jiella mangrovi]